MVETRSATRWPAARSLQADNPPPAAPRQEAPRQRVPSPEPRRPSRPAPIPAAPRSAAALHRADADSSLAPMPGGTTTVHDKNVTPRLAPGSAYPVGIDT